jgi:hypothetical protein
MMFASKRPASRRSDTSLAKRPRLNDKFAPRRKTRFVEKTGFPTGSDSDSSTPEHALVDEDGDEQSPTTDQGRSLGPGNDVPSILNMI